MLEQANSLLFHKLIYHVTQNGTNSVEALVGLTDVGKTYIVEEDLLDDEDSNGLAEL